MNENSVNPIGKVRSIESGTHAKVGVPDRSENAVVRENSSSETNRSVKQSGNETILAKNMSNISIHFNVDEETNRLIVVVSERDSGRVIRTIPASELHKLQAGELLKLTA
jgi:uncharacterized FlaG/YvyC family protein